MRLKRAVDAAFASGSVRSYDCGGNDGTAAIGRAVVEHLGSVVVTFRRVANGRWSRAINNLG